MVFFSRTTAAQTFIIAHTSALKYRSGSCLVKTGNVATYLPRLMSSQLFLTLYTPVTIYTPPPSPILLSCCSLAQRRTCARDFLFFCRTGRPKSYWMGRGSRPPLKITTEHAQRQTVLMLWCAGKKNVIFSSVHSSRRQKKSSTLRQVKNFLTDMINRVA